MKASWKDYWQIGKKLSLRRQVNASRLLASFYRSRMLKAPQHQGMPLSLSIEPTTGCNLRCPECPSGLRSFTRPTGSLDENLFRQITEELAPELVYMLFYFQGEPFLHPRLLSMVNYAASKNIYTATSTNAHFLKEKAARETVESGLHRLIISIDGTTQDTYKAYRIGGNLERVIEGTRNIIQWKKKLRSATPHVIFQFLVVKPNEHQVPEVYRLANELGVDEVRLKTAQIYDYENGSPLIPENPRYSRYKQLKNGKWHFKNRLLDHCWKMWHSSVITWDGQVVPCCFDKDASHSMGRVGEQSFKDIWQSERYHRFRATLLTGRQKIDICRNCTEGTKIWA